MDDINQYDLIFLNFQNSTDYIQRNAYLLERVLEIVNQRKTTWQGIRQQNVIIGMSMGGLVARYALRDMELNSQNHETRLFISHDVPHHGANIPVGMQAAVQHLGPWKIVNAGGNFPWISWVDMFPTVADALDMFNSPAAKQMLIQRYTLSGQSLTADNSMHTTFMNELNTLGWPQNTRNVSLSNGSCNGTKHFADNNTIFTISGARPMTYFGSLWRSLAMTIVGASGGTLNTIGTLNNPQFNHWALFWQFPLSLFATSSSVGMDFKIRAVPASGTQEIYRGDIYSKKKILWTINVKNYFIKCHVNSSTGMLPLDNAPGGVYDVEAFGIDEGIITNQLPSFFQGYVTADVLENRFCFIPTVSSLAINNPWQNCTTNICAGVACMRNSSIADYFAPQNNEIHISYTQPATNWLLNTQGPLVTCNRICVSSLEISGPSEVCTSASYSLTGLPSGTQVNWNLAGGGGSVATLSTIGALATVTSIGNGTITLEATISSVANCYPQLTVTKILKVGSPTDETLIAQYNSGVFSGQLLQENNCMEPYLPGSFQATVNWFDYVEGTYNWSLFSKSSNAIVNVQLAFDNKSAIITIRPQNAHATFKLTSTNTCGSFSKYFKFNASTTNCPVIEEIEWSVSPNPVMNRIVVNSGTSTIFEIRIKDKMGNIMKSFRSNNKGLFQYDLSALKPDFYIIEVFDGKKWMAKKIIKH